MKEHSQLCNFGKMHRESGFISALMLCLSNHMINFQFFKLIKFQLITRSMTLELFVRLNSTIKPYVILNYLFVYI